MADDDDDDYMTMTFGDDAGTASKPAAESSLQRRIRLQRQGRERGRIPSKAELAKAAEEEREAALGRSLIDAPAASSKTPSKPSSGGWPPAPTASHKPVNKGLAMMAKMGFVAGQALGKRREGRGDGAAAAGEGKSEGKGEGDGHDQEEDRPVTEPIRIQVKRDRAGIGAVDKEKEDKKRAAAAAAAEGGGDGGPDAKRLRLDDLDPLAYRDRLRQEREAGRLERQVHAAQVVAERMASGDDDEEDGKGEHDDEKDLASVNVLWRGLVQERRAKERERALRQKAQRLLDKSLRGTGTGGGGAGYGEEAYDSGDGGDDSDEDDADRLARGKGPARSFLDSGLKRKVASGGEDSDDDEKNDDEDEELEAFNALPPRERLQKVVDWMRQNRHYCFWCKYTYPDATMDGCPGPTEEDHD